MKRRMFWQVLIWFAGFLTSFAIYPWTKKASPQELTPDYLAQLRGRGVALLVEAGRGGWIAWHDPGLSTLRFKHVNQTTSQIVQFRLNGKEIVYRDGQPMGTFPRAWIDEFEIKHAKLYAFMEDQFVEMTRWAREQPFE